MIEVNWSALRSVVAAVLVLITVFVGVYGLGRTYRTRSRKLTKAGRRVAAVMICSGLASIAVTSLDSHFAEKRAAAEAAAQDERFRLQMYSLSTLQSRMAESLAKQEDISRDARSTLTSSQELQLETIESTNSILESLFEQGNRVSIDRTAVFVHVMCELSEARKLDGPLKIEGVSMRIQEGFAPPRLRLASQESRPYNTGVLFHQFSGELGPYESFGAWRSARVSFRVLATTLSNGIPLEEYKRNWSEDPERAKSARCPISIRLILNGRAVLQASGVLLEQDGGRAMIADISGVPVDNGRIPSFGRRSESRLSAGR